MEDKNRPNHIPEKHDPEWPHEKVKCAQCLREIPKSEALVPEAQDYALYYCGIECFEEWRKQSGKRNKQE
jgi:hypothetical protein